MDASANGPNSKVGQLINDGADHVNYKSFRGYTRPPLHMASYKRQFVIADLLINNGTDVNAKGSNAGNTPLHIVSNRGHYWISKLLIDNGAGADVNAKNYYNSFTPLIWTTDHTGNT